MWLLTYEVNDYDQYGEYYLKVWSNKPSKQQLGRVLEQHGSAYSVDEVWDNVGRTKPTTGNDVWYRFEEISE